MTLRVYASEAFLGDIADGQYFLTSKWSMSEAIHAVSTAIVKNLASRYLKFPVAAEEKLSIKRDFYEIAGLPGCIGIPSSHRLNWQAVQ